MTEADVRRYLLRYRAEKKNIRTILEQIAELKESKASAGSPALDAMPKGGEISDLSDYAARLDELERELDFERTRAGRFLCDIVELINRLPDAREREVLTLYYVRGRKWEEICVACGYSWRQVFRIRNRAVKNLLEVFDA